MILKKINHKHLFVKIIFILFGFCVFAYGNTKYFQQYVNYNIDVSLDVDYHSLYVTEIMLYTNNSADTLTELYFHLYMNKYRKKSLANPGIIEDKGSITINQVFENDSENDKGTVDQTLYHLPLNDPLFPGYSVRLKYKFIVILPRASVRYGYFGDHFDVGNWYVTPVVYDRHGWHLNQHINNEFYQEWGDFKVNIHVPKGFLVGATGNLLNPTEAFADTGFYIQNYYLESEKDTSLNLWKYEANNVHDFAWTTDPAYNLLQSEWNGITFNVLAFDYNVKSWRQVLDWGPKALKFLSENFGMYPYDQITIADTYIKAGGIEYPQITFINDMIHPEYQNAAFRTTIIHEMAHNWFYGIIGSNQTEKGWMDEGFTTFAEIKTVEALFGRYNNYPVEERGWLYKNFSLPDDDRTMNARSYLELAKNNLDEDQINLHPDYMGYGAYTLEYDKSAMVLFMLEYTIGDSLFRKAMLEYFDKWKFKHPEPDDFIFSIERTAKRELDWFFEQWLNTNRKLDYAITGVSGKWDNADSNKKFLAKVDFEKLGKIFMPIDFVVYLKNNDSIYYQIPVDRFSKPKPDFYTLPYWHFSQKKYTADLVLDEEIESVVIDPSLRLMDINMLNNNSDCIPDQEFYFMKNTSTATSLNKYMWEIWPLAFYNDIDFAKLGVNLNGHYLDIDHRLNLDLWYKTVKGNIDYHFNYTTPVNCLGKFSELYLRSFTLDGREGAQLSIKHLLDIFWYNQPRYTIEVGIAYHKLFDKRYLMNEWDFGNQNTIFVKWNSETSYYRNYKPKNSFIINFLSSIFSQNFQFSQLTFEWQYKYWKSYSEWEGNIRFFSGISEGKTPKQFLYNLSGDNGWGEFNQQFYRSKGSLPYPWRRNGHLYKKGGGNIRGYSLINAFNLLDSKIAALNLDLTLPSPLVETSIPVIEDIFPIIFADVGAVWNTKIPSFKSFKKSFGFSLSWDSHHYLDYFLYLQQIRFEFPLWLSHAGPSSKNLDFRWLVRFDFSD